MLIDGRTLPAAHVLETDLCIIGAGAAGITLALAFADDPEIDVCLVESGGFEFDAAVQELYRGATRGVAYEAYDTRMRMFGGSTNHWGGWCRPLEEADFEVRPWVPHSGWPIRLADLAPYYDKAGALCEVDSTGLSVGSLVGAPRPAGAEPRRQPAAQHDLPGQPADPLRRGLPRPPARRRQPRDLPEQQRRRPSGGRRAAPRSSASRRSARSPATASRSPRAVSCWPAAASRTPACCCARRAPRTACPTRTTSSGASSWSMPISISASSRSATTWDPRFYLNGTPVPGAGGMEVNSHLGLRPGGRGRGADRGGRRAGAAAAAEPWREVAAADHRLAQAGALSRRARPSPAAGAGGYRRARQPRRRQAGP